MTKHIVMFKFRDDIPSTVRRAVSADFKEGIEALPEVIGVIRKIHVGFNINSDEKWDICLDSTFDNLNDVRTYSNHPAHKAVGKAIMQYISQRSCVDFEQD